MNIVSSVVKKSRRSLRGKELRPNSPEKTTDEQLTEVAEIVSLKDIPLEERRKEANKPLFLDRY